MIIREERKKGVVIPTEAKAKIPQRQKLGVLGTPTAFVKSLDEKYLSDEGEFRRKAEVIRQEKVNNDDGKKSIYARMQPFNRPDLCDLLNQRIDVLYKLDVNGEPVLRWCQGEVVEVLEERSKPTVVVLWDPTPDITDSEEASETEQILMPGKWNSNVAGAWRMDVNITIDDVEYDVHDDIPESDDDDNLSDEEDDEMS